MENVTKVLFLGYCYRIIGFVNTEKMVHFAILKLLQNLNMVSMVLTTRLDCQKCYTGDTVDVTLGL